jgi:hypothetical protein
MSENSNFNAIFGGVVPTTPSPTINRKFGSFSSQVTQSLLIPLISTPINTETTNESDGVSVNLLSGNIEFDTAGKYMVEATILFHHNSPLSPDSAYAWIQKSGLDVAESTRSIRLNQNINMTTLTLSYMVNIGVTTDTIRLYFTTSSIDIEVYYDNSVSGIPNSSSVIVNVFQIADQR